ncbi:MAG: ferredoxin:glutaredoxin reductase [Proteobacteria bacterium]|nr:ferredoxin:glutaredoxin reductase [Pseudomonadota bacterium]
MKEKKLPPPRVLQHLEKIRELARQKGYFLNPDTEHTYALVESLLVNMDRYGYPSCPCRLAAGKREEDRDIICPCDYRDADLAEYGTCFCALYVNEEIAGGMGEASPIPERRPGIEERRKKGKQVPP